MKKGYTNYKQIIMRKILITGGAGFIGSHVVRYFVKNYKDYLIYNLDNLSYAGNLKNLIDIEDYKNYKFLYADIRNSIKIDSIFKKYKFDSIIHLAAESHVDRSIENPLDFLNTNVLGTINLLNSFYKINNENFKNKLFYHVSTDEVYGSLGETGLFVEESQYMPNSPYSASKASSDHFVRAYSETFKIPHLISNCSNNYGPNQFPEKLIPLFVNNIIKNRRLPVYGDGKNVRDWLYVGDHVEAIDKIFHSGIENETFNIGSNNEWDNLSLVKLICDLMDKKLNRVAGTSQKLIDFVTDRKGHDYRYAIDSTKVKEKVGWIAKTEFNEGISKTLDWYLSNQNWLDDVISGKYQVYNQKNKSK